MTPLFVGTKEIAARYGVTVGTIIKWVRAGVLPVIKVNQRVWLFSIEACDAALNRRTQLVRA